MSNQEIIQEFYAAVTRGDHDAVTAMIHPDFVGEEADGLPYGGVYGKGVEAWWRLVHAVFGTWKDFKVEDVYSMHDDTGTRFGMRLRATGADPRSGETFETRMFEIWTLKDGKIFAVEPFYWDTHLLHEIHRRGQETA